MISTRNANIFRNNKAEDIETIGNLLFGTGIVDDTSPFAQMCGHCRKVNKNKKGQHLWHYQIFNLTFKNIHNEKVLKHILPQIAKRFYISLSIVIVGKCSDDTNGIEDDITSLQFDFEIIGSDHKEVCYYSCFHLDKHFENSTSTLAHPCYHFHYGGKKLRSRLSSESCKIGNSLLIDSPRIAHPPLGLISGIDFLLSNFYPDERSKLIKEHDYRRILRKYQERLWRPYVKVLASMWKDTKANSAWKPTDIWPQLID